MKDFYDKYFEGTFWVPNKLCNQIVATLYIDNEGKVTISTLESLTKNSSLVSWDKIEVAFGHLISQHDSRSYSIKLYNLHKSSECSGSMPLIKYTSSHSLISDFDKYVETLSYNTIMLNSSLINDWVPTTGFKINDNKSETYSVNLNYEQPQIVDLFKNDDYYVYIFFRAQYKIAPRRKSTIEEDVFINIETSVSSDINELYRIKTIVERLFNIILFIPFYSTTSEFKTIKKSTYKVLKNNSSLFLGYANKLDYQKFVENSQFIFANWFEKQDKLKFAILNFFSVFGQPGVLVENKYLTYTSILENYHKNNMKKESTLKERLLNILNNSSIASKFDDIESYAEKLKITRNYHAHLEEKHENKAMPVKEIQNANKILEFVIRELFLKELQIDNHMTNPNFLNRLVFK